MKSGRGAQGPGAKRPRTGFSAPELARHPERNAGRSPGSGTAAETASWARTRATRCLIGAAAPRQQPRRSSRQSADTGRGT